MNDLISRQAAIEAIERNTCNTQRAIDAVKVLPPAQPELPELIMCEDCKHWIEGPTNSYCFKLYKMGVLNIYDYMTTEYDFCSKAERRTDEQDSE